jgi:murein tripeptide amidase MpaA
MTKRLLILILQLTLSISNLWSQDVIKDNQLRNLVREFRQAEVTIPYPGTKAIDMLTRNVSITSVKDKKVYINISPVTINWFLERNFNYSIIERADNKGIISASSLNQVMDWHSYPTYTQYDSILNVFTSTYPSLCHLDTIGKSINGKYIFALKISDNASLKEDEPKVFYSSSIHGDEIGSYVLMLRLADYLLKNYNLNSRVKNMVDNLEIWINPLANPDGTYISGNTIISPTRYNANGYDLNRNFPDPMDPSIVPQKEVVDMMKFLKKYRFTISANFHAGDEVVNYPWDRWLSKIHADDSWFNSISRAYADTVHKYSATGYLTDLDNGVTRGAVWYIIYGGRQDYVTWELHGREVTIELDFTKQTPAAQLDLLWQYNWRSLLGYLESALYGIHGFTKDEHTGGVVPAKVLISGHDVDRSESYSDSLTGRFIRLLSPGSWNLTFSANGYKDTTVNNVVVIAGQRTDLLVNMKSVTSSIDTTDPQVPLLYPNPASSKIMVKLPDKLKGVINIRIINQAGAAVADFDDNYIPGYPLVIDINKLSAGVYTIIFRQISSGFTYRSRFISLGRGN